MYCSQSDICPSRISESRLIELTNDSNVGVTVDTAIVNSAIEDADDIIDGFIRGKVSLPLADTPKLIRQFSEAISVYNLYKRREMIELPESVTKDYDNAIKMLKLVQKGELMLGTETSAVASGNLSVNKTAEDRVFSKERLKQF